MKLHIDRTCHGGWAWQREYGVGNYGRICVGAPNAEDGFCPMYRRFELGLGWCPGRLTISLIVIEIELSWFYRDEAEA